MVLSAVEDGVFHARSISVLPLVASLVAIRFDTASGTPWSVSREGVLDQPASPAVLLARMR